MVRAPPNAALLPPGTGMSPPAGATLPHSLTQYPVWLWQTAFQRAVAGSGSRCRSVPSVRIGWGLGIKLGKGGAPVFTVGLKTIQSSTPFIHSVHRTDNLVWSPSAGRRDSYCGGGGRCEDAGDGRTQTFHPCEGMDRSHATQPAPDKTKKIMDLKLLQTLQSVLNLSRGYVSNDAECRCIANCCLLQKLRDGPWYPEKRRFLLFENALQSFSRRR